MLVIVGLVILVVALIVGVAGVLSNAGSAHSLGHGFAVFGYHVTGSTGTLFLYGIVVGVVAVLGLGLLLASTRRTARRGRIARKGLKESRRETAEVSLDRDQLLDERDAVRADRVTQSPIAASDGRAPPPPDDRLSARPRLFRGRSGSQPSSSDAAPSRRL